MLDRIPLDIIDVPLEVLLAADRTHNSSVARCPARHAAPGSAIFSRRPVSLARTPPRSAPIACCNRNRYRAMAAPRTRLSQVFCYRVNYPARVVHCSGGAHRAPGLLRASSERRGGDGQPPAPFGVYTTTSTGQGLSASKCNTRPIRTRGGSSVSQTTSESMSDLRVAIPRALDPNRSTSSGSRSSRRRRADSCSQERPCVSIPSVATCSVRDA
jgi:hypothetical protein